MGDATTTATTATTTATTATTTTATTTTTTTAASTITTITGGNGIKRVTPTHKACGGVPPWVKVMIDIMQYQDCKIHSNMKDNKLDRFCIDCVGSFCNQCSSDHQGHEHIKIRRYVYNDVIKRPDFQKHFDCSGIQGYVTNKNKVLFLKRRNESQQVKEQQQNTKDHRCYICNQTLIDASFCSIQCKVFAITENAEEPAVDDNGLHIAGAKPILTPPKIKRRKGIPYRAPFF